MATTSFSLESMVLEGPAKSHPADARKRKPSKAQKALAFIEGTGFSDEGKPLPVQHVSLSVKEYNKLVQDMNPHRIARAAALKAMKGR